jgi:hypothetical protein
MVDYQVISNDTESQEKLCRICLESEIDDSDEFINPCLCSGTSKWVHTKCLDEWRATSLNPDAFTVCMTCNYTYKMELYTPTPSVFGHINSFLSSHTKILALINFIIGLFISYFTMLIDSFASNFTFGLCQFTFSRVGLDRWRTGLTY